MIKIAFFFNKVFSLTEEEMVSFLDNYNGIDDKIIRRVSSSLTPSNKQFLIKNSKYGVGFAKEYLRGINYDLSLEMNEEYNICLEKIAQSLDINKEEIKYYISILGQKNNHILKTIDYKMLAPEFRKLYSLDYSNKISNTDRLFFSNSIQRSITSFGSSPEKIEILKELFDYINNNYSDNWEAYVYLMTSSFESNIDFYNSLKLNNVGKIFTESDIKKLMAYFSIVDRDYKISDIESIISIDKVRSEYIEKVFNNPNAAQWDMQNAILEKKYGINLKYADHLINRFKLDDNFDKELLDMFENIKTILKMKKDSLREYEKQTKLEEMINIIDLQKN